MKTDGRKDFDVIKKLLLCALALFVILPAGAEIELQRTVSEAMNADGTRDIIYRVENTGDTAVTDVKVIDLGMEAAFFDVMEPGSHEVFTLSAPASDDTVSAPSVEWSEDGAVSTASCGGVPVPEIPAAIKVSVSADCNELVRGSGMTLHVYVRNSGTVPVSDITVTDDGMGAIALIRGPVAPGETVESVREFIIDSDTDITVRAQGVSASGKCVSASSNTISIVVTDDVFEGEQLSVTAFDAGGGRAEVTIGNRGPDLKDIRVGLLSGGDTFTLAVLGRENVTVMIENAPEGATRAYVCRADEENGHISVLSDEFCVTGKGEGVSPFVTGRRISDGGEGIYPTLLGIGSCTVVLLALILHISRMRYKSEEKREKRHREEVRTLLRAEAREQMAKTKQIKFKNGK